MLNWSDLWRNLIGCIYRGICYECFHNPNMAIMILTPAPRAAADVVDADQGMLWILQGSVTMTTGYKASA